MCRSTILAWPRYSPSRIPSSSIVLYGFASCLNCLRLIFLSFFLSFFFSLYKEKGGKKEGRRKWKKEGRNAGDRAKEGTQERNEV